MDPASLNQNVSAPVSTPTPTPTPVQVPKQNSFLVLLVIVLLVAVVLLVGLLFYKSGYFDQEQSDTQAGSQLPTMVPQGSSNNGIGFEEARAMIQAGVEKWDSLEYIQYRAKGSDGDEIPYFIKNYQKDFSNNEYFSNIFYPTECTEPPFAGCYYGDVYINKAGKYYHHDLQDSSNLAEIEQTEVYYVVDPDEIRGDLESKINVDPTKYSAVATIVDGMFEQQSVKYVKIHFYFYENSEVNGFLSKFKAHADIVFDSYWIEAVINQSGELLELEMPYKFSEITYNFTYNEPVTIELPEL